MIICPFTGLENSLRLPSRGVDPDPLEGSDWPRLKPRGQQMNSETSSGSSGHPVWTERLLSSHLSSPQCYAAGMQMGGGPGLHNSTRESLRCSCNCFPPTPQIQRWPSHCPLTLGEELTTLGQQPQPIDLLQR